MPYRQTLFAQDQIYHVFNRGVARQPIFIFHNHYLRFLALIDYYRHVNTPTSFSHFMKISLETRQEILETLIKENILNVEILAFCLMPNHYHLLLKQVAENGIIKFMGNIQNGYVKYLNIKNERVGPLFQSAFKAKMIETDEQLLHVARYIHLNPSTSYLTEINKLEEYPWSSLSAYLTKPLQYPFLNTELINNFFKSQDKHREFIFDQAEYQRELDKIKHLILE